VVNARSIGRVPVVVLVNAMLLTLGNPIGADEIEAPPNVLFSSEWPLSPAPVDDGFSPRFGIRKGRGFQVVKPIEVNDRKYEFNLSGPVVKSKSKKKSFGLHFEFRF
jgi:hypothetical protein